MKEKGLFEAKTDHFGKEVCFRDFHWQTGPALSIANIIIAHKHTVPYIETSRIRRIRGNTDPKTATPSHEARYWCLNMENALISFEEKSSVEG